MRCRHKRVKFLSLLYDDGNIFKVLFQCKDCKTIFVDVKVRAWRSS